jgi:hypothetical protein
MYCPERLSGLPLDSGRLGAGMCSAIAADLTVWQSHFHAIQVGREGADLMQGFIEVVSAAGFFEGTANLADPVEAESCSFTFDPVADRA